MLGLAGDDSSEDEAPLVLPCRATTGLRSLFTRDDAPAPDGNHAFQWSKPRRARPAAPDKALPEPLHSCAVDLYQQADGWQWHAMGRVTAVLTLTPDGATLACRDPQQREVLSVALRPDTLFEFGAAGGEEAVLHLSEPQGNAWRLGFPDPAAANAFAPHLCLCAFAVRLRAPPPCPATLYDVRRGAGGAVDEGDTVGIRLAVWAVDTVAGAPVRLGSALVSGDGAALQRLTLGDTEPWPGLSGGVVGMQRGGMRLWFTANADSSSLTAICVELVKVKKASPPPLPLSAPPPALDAVAAPPLPDVCFAAPPTLPTTELPPGLVAAVGTSLPPLPATAALPDPSLLPLLPLLPTGVPWLGGPPAHTAAEPQRLQEVADRLDRLAQRLETVDVAAQLSRNNAVLTAAFRGIAQQLLGRGPVTPEGGPAAEGAQAEAEEAGRGLAECKGRLAAAERQLAGEVAAREALQAQLDVEREEACCRLEEAARVHAGAVEALRRQHQQEMEAAVAEAYARGCAVTAAALPDPETATLRIRCETLQADLEAARGTADSVRRAHAAEVAALQQLVAAHEEARVQGLDRERQWRARGEEPDVPLPRLAFAKHLKEAMNAVYFGLEETLRQLPPLDNGCVPLDAVLLSLVRVVKEQTRRTLEELPPDPEHPIGPAPCVLDLPAVAAADLPPPPPISTDYLCPQEHLP